MYVTLFMLMLTLTIGQGEPQHIVKALEVSEAECELQRPIVEREVLTHQDLARDVNDRHVKAVYSTECIPL